ncbi:hypothetical protein T459_26952 [Capsicum annuum]|uniref:Late blight resistance protein R1A-like N-terminal domain-containing protein n=1 Tax=Capsicum annuum TaxID=4072 RepID=A0A2G2YCI9_CAPAN|nr:hypothetical protein T459_26952 [Capsicum annuum]
MASAVAELTWLVGLFQELRVHVTLPVLVFSDSNSVIQLDNNPVFYERTKHIEIDCHFIRDKIKDGLIKALYVQFSYQLADLLTKGLSLAQHTHLLSKLGNHLDSSTNNELHNAAEQLAFVVVSLVALEAAHPENEISAQLRDIFIETRAVIFEICSHMNNQAGSTSGFIIVISDLLKIIRLENIAERIKAAKPSRSSSPITMAIVGSIVALVDGVIFILSLLNVKRYDVLPVCVLKDKLIYLEVFFTLTAKQCIEHERMKDLLAHPEDVAYTAIRLCFCAAACKMEENDHQTRVRISDEYHNLLKRLSPFRPELRSIYQSLLIGSKSSGTEPIMDAKSMSNFVDAINKDLMELLGHNASWKVTFDDRIPWLKQGLPYLSTFLHDIASKRTPLEEFNSHQSHMEDIAIEAAIVIYSSYDERMNVRSTEIDRKHFLWQLNFNCVKVEIGLIQLLNNEATIIAPLKDLIDDVREQLIFLGTLQMDSTEQCKEQTKIADLLTLIQSVNNQACFIIDFVSRHMKKEDTEHET